MLILHSLKDVDIISVFFFSAEDAINKLIEVGKGAFDRDLHKFSTLFVGLVGRDGSFLLRLMHVYVLCC